MALKMQSIGFRISCADDYIAIAGTPEPLRIVWAHIDFMQAYDTDAIMNVIRLPDGWFSGTYARPSDGLPFTRWTFNSEDFPALGADAPTKRALLAAIKSLEQAIDRLAESGDAAVLLMAGFFDGVQRGAQK